MLCLVFLQPGEAIFSLSNVSLDFLPAFLSRKKRESATSKVFFRFLFFQKKEEPSFQGFPGGEGFAEE